MTSLIAERMTDAQVEQTSLIGHDVTRDNFSEQQKQERDSDSDMDTISEMDHIDFSDLSSDEALVQTPKLDFTSHIRSPNVSLRERIIRRMNRILPSIVVITLHLVLLGSWYFAPIVFFNMCAVYQLYQLANTCKFLINHIESERRIEESESKDWKQEYEMLATSSDHHSILKFDELVHYVIVANYKERLDTLTEMIDRLLETCSIANQVVLILGCEARENGIKEKAEKLIARYEGHFLDVLASYHPADVPGEIPGKGSNEAYVAKEVIAPYHRRHFADRMSHAVITVTDADSLLPMGYLECVSCKYALDPERRYRWYQAPVLHHANILKVPSITQVAAILVGVYEVQSKCDKFEEPMPFSTFTMSLDVVEEIGGFDPDIVAEDWHMYLKSVMLTEGKMKMEPVYLPIINYCVEGDTYMHSLYERFQQAKRHAWACTEISMFMNMWMLFPTKERKRPSFWRFAGVLLAMSMIHIGQAVLLIPVQILTAISLVRHGVIDKILYNDPFSARIMQASIPFQIINAGCLLMLVAVIYRHTSFYVKYSPTMKKWVKRWGSLPSRLGLTIYYGLTWNLWGLLYGTFIIYIPTVYSFIKMMFVDYINFNVSLKGKDYVQGLSKSVDSRNDV